MKRGHFFQQTKQKKSKKWTEKGNQYIIYLLIKTIRLMINKEK